MRQRSTAMVDVFSPSKRSAIMSRIRARDTGPERVVRSLIHKHGYRFRLHCPDLPGTPDIVLPRHRKIIFVHGCFWHGHKGCRRGRLPKSNAGFWHAKITGNVKRDGRALRQLRRLGWQVLVVWECWLQDNAQLNAHVLRFLNTIPTCRPKRNQTKQDSKTAQSR